MQIPDYWTPSKKLLSDPGFLHQLQGLDPDSIAETSIDKIVKDYFKSLEFEPATLAKISVAAEVLCKWARALIEYRLVLKV